MSEVILDNKNLFKEIHVRCERKRLLEMISHKQISVWFFLLEECKLIFSYKKCLIIEKKHCEVRMQRCRDNITKCSKVP
jgi:hypothetical protein